MCGYITVYMSLFLLLLINNLEQCSRTGAIRPTWKWTCSTKTVCVEYLEGMRPHTVCVSGCLAVVCVYVCVCVEYLQGMRPHTVCVSSRPAAVCLQRTRRSSRWSRWGTVTCLWDIRPSPPLTLGYSRPDGSPGGSEPSRRSDLHRGSWCSQNRPGTFLCSSCLRRLLSFFSTLPPSLHSKNSSLEMEQELSLYRMHHTRFHLYTHPIIIPLLHRKQAHFISLISV